MDSILSYSPITSAARHPLGLWLLRRVRAGIVSDNLEDNTREEVKGVNLSLGTQEGGHLCPRKCPRRSTSW